MWDVDCRKSAGGSGMDSGRLETVPQGPVHLDTVRALHQTVVSLRTALEVSKNELKELKNKYQQHSQCTDYADVIEKLTLENHILRRKIIDSGGAFDQRESNVSSENIKLEVTYSPLESLNKDTDESQSGIDNKIASPDVENPILEKLETSNTPVEEHESSSVEQYYRTEQEQIYESSDLEISPKSNISNVEEPCSQVSLTKQETKPKSTHLPSFKTKFELSSKLDVKIKVRTLKDGVESSTTSETESNLEDSNRETGKKSPDSSFYYEHKEEHFDETEDLKNHIQVKTFSTENIKMAVPNEADIKNKNDKFDVQVRITSEESLVVKDLVDRPRRKDTLNLDVDDLSLRYMSL